MEATVSFDVLFYANLALAIVCLVLLVGCFPKCRPRYKFVFLSAIPPLLYLAGIYIYELITKIMPPIEWRRVSVTYLLLLLVTFIALTRNGNGYHGKQ